MTTIYLVFLKNKYTYIKVRATTHVHPKFPMYFLNKRLNMSYHFTIKFNSCCVMASLWQHYHYWSGPILEFKGSIKHVQKGYPIFCSLSNAHWQSTFANVIADPISVIPFSHLQRYFFVPFWNWKKEIRFVKVIDILANMIYELHDSCWQFFAGTKKVELERLPW